jgi:hypothetical protein
VSTIILISIHGTGFTILGYFALFTPQTVPWILDTKEHWAGWPFNTVPAMIDYYYIVELGCYLHQLMSVLLQDIVQLIVFIFRIFMPLALL